MEPIYDRNGQTVGWLKDGVIYDRTPKPRAFIHNGAIFTYDRRYIGRFDNGYFRDRSGRSVAFIKSASGGPILPIPEIPPTPPILPIPPIAPIPPISPIPAMPSLSWSNLDWETFLRGMS